MKQDWQQQTVIDVGEIPERCPGSADRVQLSRNAVIKTLRFDLVEFN
jgi:hypothetical protein